MASILWRFLSCWAGICDDDGLGEPSDRVENAGEGEGEREGVPGSNMGLPGRRVRRVRVGDGD